MSLEAVDAVVNGRDQKIGYEGNTQTLKQEAITESSFSQKRTPLHCMGVKDLVRFMLSGGAAEKLQIGPKVTTSNTSLK